MATTVRISEHSKKVLSEIAKIEKKPMQTILNEAIEYKRRQIFFDKLDAEYEKLDPEGWKELREEEKLYESTLSDGLKD